MDWFILAIASAFLFALVAVLDKRLLSEYLPGARSLYFLVGLVQSFISLGILLTGSWDSIPSNQMIVIAASSGITMGLGIICVFVGLRHLDVSRVIPISQSYPVSVAIMATIFLGEHLPVIKIVAILATVLGAALIAIDPDQKKKNSNPILIYALVFLGSIFNALANVTFKYALAAFKFWDLFATRAFFLGSTLILASYHRGIGNDVRGVITNKSAARLFIMAEVLTAPAALVAMLSSLALGPVSLASTIISTRPMFVLIISGLLSTKYWKLLDEPFTKRTLPSKLISTSLIIGGIIALTSN